MGQPSFQASNAIIYLTYGTFLSVLTHHTLRYTEMLTITSYMQGLGLIRCVVLEAPDQIGIPSSKPDTEGSAAAPSGDDACLLLFSRLSPPSES